MLLTDDEGWVVDSGNAEKGEEEEEEENGVTIMMPWDRDKKWVAAQSREQFPILEDIKVVNWQWRRQDERRHVIEG